MNAPVRFPRFFVTALSPCPYLPGKSERKVFTELKGDNADELNDALGRIGFRIVIFPGGTARAVGHLLQRYYGSLHAHQTTAPFQPQMLDFDQLNALIGTPELLQTGKRYEN